MISTKLGTQTFSKAPQVHDFHDEDRGTRYTPATAETTKDGERNVGDILNQVANPGGRDPNRQVRKAHNTLDKDDFLKLMLTQMKNQDPMNPMQSHEMAAQLAQFTSLEQLFNVNKNLEGLTRAQDPVQRYEALNFLGKTIKADTSQIFRQQGDQGSDLRFNLGLDAAKVKITVADANGQTVKTLEFGGLKKGPNHISWAGTDDRDQDVKPGKYTFNVEALTSGGTKVGVTTETAGTITGVNYTPEGPMLMVGDQKVRMQDVQRIEDEHLKEEFNHEMAQPAIPLGAGGNATNGGSNAAAQRGTQGTAQPNQVAHHRPKMIPEDKPELKNLRNLLPLEVATANAAAPNGLGGINTNVAFQKR